MVRRLVWFVIGAGVAVFVIMKIRAYLRKARPRRSVTVLPNPRTASASRPAHSSIGYEPEWPSAKRSSAKRSTCPMTNLDADPFLIHHPRNTS